MGPQSQSSKSTAHLQDIIGILPEGFRNRVLTRISELDGWISAGLIPTESFVDHCVLDWEGGDGAFAFAFLLRGARHVIVIDSWLDLDNISDVMKNVSGLTFQKASIHDFIKGSASKSEGQINLVFANTVTEHMQELPRDLCAVRNILNPEGFFFTNHDNYYQPVGSHDHGFLFYGDNNQIVALGPRCWADPAKCEASTEHRLGLLRNYPWTWNDKDERSKDPLNCHDCHYYKRSRPWAHLLFQDEFAKVFSGNCFRTGIAGASLNKLNPFQVRQYIIESGFIVKNERRLMIDNMPPDQLLSGDYPFTERDLRTTMVQILARPSI